MDQINYTLLEQYRKTKHGRTEIIYEFKFEHDFNYIKYKYVPDYAIDKAFAKILVEATAKANGDDWISFYITNKKFDDTVYVSFDRVELIKPERIRINIDFIAQYKLKMFLFDGPLQIDITIVEKRKKDDDDDDNNDDNDEDDSDSDDDNDDRVLMMIQQLH